MRRCKVVLACQGSIHRLGFFGVLFGILLGFLAFLFFSPAWNYLVPRSPPLVFSFFVFISFLYFLSFFLCFAFLFFSFFPFLGGFNQVNPTPPQPPYQPLGWSYRVCCNTNKDEGAVLGAEAAIPAPCWPATGSSHRLDTSSSTASCEWTA